ncbi:MAG: helix-turn-helix domain-containing protein [Bacillota bacterium]
MDKLWKLLIDKNLTKTDLRRAVGMSTSTLSRMSKNENVSMDLLDKICTVLDCDIKEIIEHIKVDN